MNDSLLIVQLHLDDTNAELLEVMRGLKESREQGFPHIAAVIGGFDHDPREVYEIPEARAFCRRLVTLGLPSYLDPLTALKPIPDPTLAAALGAGEIWLTAEGRMRREFPMSVAVLDQVTAAICDMNAAADAALGPFRPTSA